MKFNYKSLLFLFIAFAMAGVLTSCEDDDTAPNGGQPRVEYVRITDPDAADSLLVMAPQGNMVAIIGQNLQDAQEVWFNDQQAVLSPTLITSTTIITNVPADIPTDITNKLAIIFANGDTLFHDFIVDISEPLLLKMDSEYVPIGEVATIRGDYFYEPLTVMFTGGVEGEVVTVEDKMIEVRVPEGAEPGPITITTNFGETESDFWFRDNRNIIASFDKGTAGLWHGANFIKETDPAIPNINGNFIRVDHELGEWAWFEFYVGASDSEVAQETKHIPADALANPGDYQLKFEIYTLAPLTGAEIKMFVGPNMGDNRGTSYTWKPNIGETGGWQTVTIPFESFYNDNSKFAYNPAGYGVSFHFSGPLAVHANFAMDNVRVVPTTID